MNLFDDQLIGARAPQSLQEMVTRIGGKNPYGLPLYRLVNAESVHHKAFGEFSDWPEEASLQQRNGIELNEDGQWDAVGTKPLRTVTEMRWVNAYPTQHGWLIERWYPAHMFGVRKDWEANPLLGPYPEDGMYVDCCKAIPRIPSLREIENVIQAVEYKIQNKEGNVRLRTQRRAEQIWGALEKDREKKKQEMRLRIHDHSKPLWGDSLAAGRLRTELAERAGIRSHVGS